jgi:hypothetical protein
MTCFDLLHEQLDPHPQDELFVLDPFDDIPKNITYPRINKLNIKGNNTITHDNVLLPLHIRFRTYVHKRIYNA